MWVKTAWKVVLILMRMHYLTWSESLRESTLFDLNKQKQSKKLKVYHFHYKVKQIELQHANHESFTSKQTEYGK